MSKKLSIILVGILMGGIAGHLAAQPSSQTLILTEDGQYYVGQLDVSDFEPGEDFLYFSGYYVPWQSQDSIDYRLSTAGLEINGEVVGINLMQVSPEDIVDSSKIVSAQVDPAHAGVLSQFPNLVSVTMVGAGDDDLALLSGIISLHALQLSYTQITDQGLTYLSPLTGLRVLNLANTKVSDSGLSHLVSLGKLRTLDLASTRVTDRGLVHLENLTELRSINLFRTHADVSEVFLLRGEAGNVTDQGLSSLAKVPMLSELDLQGADITDAGIKQISQMSNLRSLNLSETEVTDASVPELSKMSGLQSIDLKGTKVTSQGAQQLRTALPGCDVTLCGTSLTKDRRGLVKP